MGSKKVTIGYKYNMGMHQVIAKKVDAILEIVVGDRSAWTGEVTSSQQIYIDAPNLFGGEKKEGGIQGYIDLMFGEPSQIKNDYLQTHIDPVIPAFRGIVSAVLRGVYLCAMSPYPKAWAWRVRYIPGKDWYPETASIGGSANPVHIIYEILTDKDSGLGVSPSLIDLANFTEAADVLFAENFGLSFALKGTDSIENVIYSIVEQIGGFFYTKPDDGLFAIRLLRDDYDVETLPLYDESNIIEFENFERPAYSEMVNEVIVQYRKKGTRYDDSVTVQNLASIQAQGGIVSETINYPGIDNAENAARAALRELKIKSTPLARARYKVNREGWTTTIGQVVKVSWAEHEIVELPFRILSVDTGNLQSGTISVEGVQDVFALPLQTYLTEQESGWVDPFAPPTPAIYRRVYEAPYRDLYQLFTQADFLLLSNAVAFVSAAIGKPDSTSQNYELWTQTGAAEYQFIEESSYATHGTLQAAIDAKELTVVIENVIGPNADVVLNEYAWIDDEAVIVTDFDPLTNIITMGRGTLDSVPSPHDLGSRIWFAGEATSIDDTEYAVAETVNVKVLPRVGPALLDIDSAPSDEVIMFGRFANPYPPGKLLIAGSEYPTSATGPFTVGWSHRDRVAQQDQLVDTTEASVGPESTTRYGLRLLDASDSSLIIERDDISGDVATVELDFTGDVILQLYSISSNGESTYRHNHTFTYTPPGGFPVDSITAPTYNPEDDITIIDGGEVTP